METLIPANDPTKKILYVSPHSYEEDEKNCTLLWTPIIAYKFVYNPRYEEPKEGISKWTRPNGYMYPIGPEIVKCIFMLGIYDTEDGILYGVHDSLDRITPLKGSPLEVALQIDIGWEITHKFLGQDDCGVLGVKKPVVKAPHL